MAVDGDLAQVGEQPRGPVPPPRQREQVGRLVDEPRGDLAVQERRVA